MTTREMVNVALRLAGLEEDTVDTEIGCEGTCIKRVLAGIDMDNATLLAAKDRGYDCVVEHHGIMGRAVRIGDQMLKDQMMRMYDFGVPINVAQKAIAKRAKQESEKMHSKNLNRQADFARLIQMPYIGLHTPADLIGQAIVQERMDELTRDRPFTTLQEVVDALGEFPEVRTALQSPAIRVGQPDSYAGRVCVLFAGVTGGGAQVYKTFFDYGVGTLIMMHMPEDDIKALTEHNKGNVIIAGHMASDSIGMNRILDAWEAEGLEITRIGGLTGGKAENNSSNEE